MDDVCFLLTIKKLPDEIWEHIFSFLKLNRDKLCLYKLTSKFISWPEKTKNTFGNIVVWFDPCMSMVYENEYNADRSMFASYETRYPYFNDVRDGMNNDIYWSLKIDEFNWKGFKNVNDVDPDLAYVLNIDRDDKFIVTEDMIYIWDWYCRHVLKSRTTEDLVFTIDDIITTCFER